MCLETYILYSLSLTHTHTQNHIHPHSHQNSLTHIDINIKKTKGTILSELLIHACVWFGAALPPLSPQCLLQHPHKTHNGGKEGWWTSVKCTPHKAAIVAEGSQEQNDNADPHAV